MRNSKTTKRIRESMEIKDINKEVDKIVKEINVKYGKIKYIKKLKSENNLVFKIIFEDNSKAILKIDSKNEKFPWMVQKEIYIYGLLKTKGIPSPKIYLSSQKNKPYFYLMEYLGDITLKDNPTDKLLIELGTIQAKIHEIEFKKQGIIFHDNIEEYSFKEWRLKNFNEQLKILLEDKIISKKVKDRLIVLVKEFKDSNRAFLCHNDFAPWQAITNLNEITGIIDWEWAESSEPLYDLAKTEMLMKIFMPNKFQLFRKGYKKDRLREYDKSKYEYILVELVGFLYFFKKNKEMISQGKKFLFELINSR